MSRLRRVIDKELGRAEVDTIESTQFISMKEMLKILPFKRETIYHWIRMKKIPHYKVAGRILFDKIEFLEFMRRYYVEADN
jgi:excisionase family DNA binding protein